MAFKCKRLVKYVWIFIPIWLFLGCKSGNKQQNILDTTRTNGSKPLKTDSTIKPLALKKRIGDFMSDTTDYIWSSKQSDSRRYWVRLVFQEEFAVYQFHGQCIYWFFTNHYKTGADKIELLWSYKTDCVLDMKFLRGSKSDKNYPKPGDAFCTYRLVNDSTMQVEYNFPEWAKKINNMEKDSIFPTYLYLEKRDGK